MGKQKLPKWAETSWMGRNFLNGQKLPKQEETSCLGSSADWQRIHSFAKWIVVSGDRTAIDCIGIRVDYHYTTASTYHTVLRSQNYQKGWDCVLNVYIWQLQRGPFQSKYINIWNIVLLYTVSLLLYVSIMSQDNQIVKCVKLIFFFKNTYIHQLVLKIWLNLEWVKYLH